MGKILEFGSMLFLGILLVLAMTHFLNGTLIEWVESKFTTHQAPSTGGMKGQELQKPAPSVVSGSNASGANNA